MEKFTKHTGTCVAIDLANIDTDQIIPKQFLKRIERTGYGEFLFWDWRFDADGRERPDFALNHPRGKEASILITGPGRTGKPVRSASGHSIAKSASQPAG